MRHQINYLVSTRYKLHEDIGILSLTKTIAVIELRMVIYETGFALTQRIYSRTADNSFKLKTMLWDLLVSL